LVTTREEREADEQAKKKRADLMAKRRAHEGCRLNQWKEKAMEKALKDFHRTPGASMRSMSVFHDIPYSTFRKRAKKIVEGYKHRSGGKYVPKLMTEGRLKMNWK